MIQLPHHRWRPNSTRELLWLIGIVAALAFLFIVICGYLFGWKWTGLLNKDLWDWIKLLIVPAVLTAGGALVQRAAKGSRSNDSE